MTGILFVPPRYIPVNNVGTPRAGSKLYVYQAGTSTLASVYATSALGAGASHTNPVIASSSGQFAAMYLDPTTTYNYKFALYTSADVLVWSEDNVAIAMDSGAIGAALYPISTTETTAGLTSSDLTLRWPYGDVRRYGAVGDGTTDDSVALQDAIDQNAAVGMAVMWTCSADWMCRSRSCLSGYRPQPFARHPEMPALMCS